jgi:hypothetical protein
MFKMSIAITAQPKIVIVPPSTSDRASSAPTPPPTPSPQTTPQYSRPPAAESIRRLTQVEIGCKPIALYPQLDPIARRFYLIL